MVTEQDTTTFKSGTARVTSFASMVGQENLAALFGSMVESDGVKSHKAAIAAINDSIPEPGAPGHFDSLRASLRARSQAAGELGKTLGIEPAPQIVVDSAVALAAQQFVKKGSAAIAMDHVDGPVPAPQAVPAAAKGPKQLS